MVRSFAVGAVLALLVGLGIGLGLRAADWVPAGLVAAPPVAPVQFPPPAAAPAASEEAATIALFQAVRDSVVAISTSGVQRDIFGRATTEVPLGTGSGWLWDGAGHVVTNAHVIEGASSATVALADGRTFDARLVGRDTIHDLAVLLIEGEALPSPLSLAAAEPPLVGSKVLAIGNPFGLDWTLTTGVVSALEREIPGDRTGGLRRGLIQTDAAINPGNSGGPLLNSAGQVIGVNSAIYSPSGGSAGIGFAIPAAVVARVVPELIRTGRYAPPTLGLLFDPRINAAVNRQGLEGVLVLDVPKGSPAEAAGVQPAQFLRDGRIVPGDVITQVDGRPVDTLDDLLAVVDARQPGDELDVTFHGEGGDRTVTMPLLPGT